MSSAMQLQRFLAVALVVLVHMASADKARLSMQQDAKCY